MANGNTSTSSGMETVEKLNPKSADLFLQQYFEFPKGDTIAFFKKNLAKLQEGPSGARLVQELFQALIKKPDSRGRVKVTRAVKNVYDPGISSKLSALLMEAGNSFRKSAKLKDVLKRATRVKEAEIGSIWALSRAVTTSTSLNFSALQKIMGEFWSYARESMVDNESILKNFAAKKLGKLHLNFHLGDLNLKGMGQKNGKIIDIPNPFYIAFGHELIHLYHDVLEMPAPQPHSTMLGINCMFNYLIWALPPNAPIYYEEDKTVGLKDLFDHCGAEFNGLTDTGNEASTSTSSSAIPKPSGQKSKSPSVLHSFSLTENQLRHEFGLPLREYFETRLAEDDPVATTSTNNQGTSGKQSKFQ